MQASELQEAHVLGEDDLEPRALDVKQADREEM
jgi:hypothetical protein